MATRRQYALMRLAAALLPLAKAFNAFPCGGDSVSILIAAARSSRRIVLKLQP